MINHKDIEIGKRIKSLRKEKKLTQVNFGRLIGRDASTVSKIEGGELESSGLVRFAICNTFGVRKEWLLTGKGPKYDDRKKLLEKMAKLLGDDIWIWFLKMRRPIIKAAYYKELKTKEEIFGPVSDEKILPYEEIEESYDPKFYKLLGQLESIYEKGDIKKIAAIESIFDALGPDKDAFKIASAYDALIKAF